MGSKRSAATLQWLTVLCLGALAGCDSALLSFVDSNVFHQTTRNRGLVCIISCDGDFSRQNLRQLSPSRCSLVIEARAVGGYYTTTLRVTSMVSVEAEERAGTMVRGLAR